MAFLKRMFIQAINHCLAPCQEEKDTTWQNYWIEQYGYKANCSRDKGSELNFSKRMAPEWSHKYRRKLIN